VSAVVRRDDGISDEGAEMIEQGAEGHDGQTVLIELGGLGPRAFSNTLSIARAAKTSTRQRRDRQAGLYCPRLAPLGAPLGGTGRSEGFAWEVIRVSPQDVQGQSHVAKALTLMGKPGSPEV
jgi:hypothetical protein